jgi:hypothetical protein
VANVSTPSTSSSDSSGMMLSTQARTLAWPIRSCTCLSNSVIIGSGSAISPYTPISEIVPPRRTTSTAVCSAANRSTPAFSIIVAGRCPPTARS